MTKKDAVIEALGKGMTSPSEIAEHINKTYGLNITPGHVSTVKGQLAKGKDGKGKPGRKKGKRGRKPRGAKPAAAAAAPARRGLTLEELTTLRQLKERAGGTEQLNAYLALFEGGR
jgi:hypothetical protein